MRSLLARNSVHCERPRFAAFMQLVYYDFRWQRAYWLYKRDEHNRFL